MESAGKAGHRPIVLSCEGGGTYTIARCQILCLHGPNQNGEYTANFGIGCVTPWKVGDTENGLQSPFSSIPTTPVCRSTMRQSDQVLSASDVPHVAPGSLLILSREVEPGSLSEVIFDDILPDTPWMSLRPLSLYIGNDRTEWPGKHKATSIGRGLDPGGGAVFLSDRKTILAD